MQNLSEDQKKQLLSNPNVLFYFVIFLETDNGDQWRISTVTLATDEGELTEDQVKEKLLKQKKERKDLEIAGMHVTKRIKETQDLFENFKVMKMILEADGKKEINMSDLDKAIEVVKIHMYKPLNLLN